MNKRSEKLQNDTASLNEFQNLPCGSKVNIEFDDLSYEVPDRTQGLKPILKNISGEFCSNELTAIMGPTGCGKTSLINLLAGYRIHKNSGTININNKPINMMQFRKISRYILQEDYVSPHFTVIESMMFASNLKLSTKLSKEQHIAEIENILDILHLQDQASTRVANLSGGERKRLCIALELLSIPTVLFLDEPTTGLDEVSATQCLSILKRLVKSGRTIICSIHTPSAKLFEMFDKVYILAEGQCVYQGSTSNILPFLKSFGLNCPITYNPADFIIEAACREYGDFHDDMVQQMNNGKTYRWLPDFEFENTQIEYINHKLDSQFELDISSKFNDRNKSWCLEYRILYLHMLKQMWRDKTYIKMKVLMQLFIGFCVSLVYTGIGTNANLIQFNYQFSCITSIAFVFVSMSPMLSHVPLEINYLRREYFNQWYRLSSYFMALITTQLPDMFVMGVVSSAILYFLTDQPVEMFRYLLFLVVALLTAMTSSSYGLVISTRLNLLNSVFLGPVIMACWIILASHSVGNPNMTTLGKVLMYSGYTRHSAEGLMSALFGFNRPDAICPKEEIFCLLTKPRFLLKLVGYENINYTFSVVCLVGFYLMFNIIAYFNFKCRLCSFEFLEKHRYYQNLKKFKVKYFNFKLY